MKVPPSLLELNDKLVPPLSFEEELALAKLASEATRPSEAMVPKGISNAGLQVTLDLLVGLPGLEPVADLAAFRILSGPYTWAVLEAVLQPAIRDNDPRARSAVEAVLASLWEKASARLRSAGL